MFIPTKKVILTHLFTLINIVGSKKPPTASFHLQGITQRIETKFNRSCVAEGRETKKGPTKLPLGSEANDAKLSHAVHPRGERDREGDGG